MSKLPEDLNSGIYSITCLINGKKYIGSSKDFNKSKNRHFKKLNNNNHNKYLQLDYNNYGKDNFVFNIEEFVENNDELLSEKEEFYFHKYKTYIKKYGENYGYNIMPPNRHGSLFSKHNESTIDVIKKNTPSVEGINNPMYGKKQTDKCKNAVSKANTKLSKEKYPEVIFLFHNMNEPKMERYKILADIFNVSWRTIQRTVIGS